MSRYDIEKFDPPPDPDLVCCICQCVLDKAVECPCRHVFCQICIERWLSNRHTCPTCRKRTRKSDLKPVLPLVQNMLNRLMMICDFRQNGCIDKVMLENFERHVKNCGYEMKACRFSKCGQPILRMYIEKHENEDCPHREIICNGDCGLMIPLSEMSVHNCVSALKAHIEEKNRMIEQLKVKLHELNNLSQSLNDQLVELRQQLSDRNRLFSEDMSDISESDSSDYMSDELIQDSEFHESWFDSAASDGSVDNNNTVSNEATNNDSVINNVVDPENNAVNGNGGSDVVQQVERTVVSSLFELSSRLERVRNQMRAVLNSGLISIQDANTLNEEVRIPSAALDAIVHNSNNSVGNTNSENNDSGTRNNENSNNNNDDNDDANIDDDGDDDHDTNNMSDSDLSIHSGDDSNDQNTPGVSETTTDSNANHPWRYLSPLESINSDWSVTDIINISALTSVSPQSARSNYDNNDNTDDNDDNNDDNDYESNDSEGNKGKQSSTHVILSQPPDSPSDTSSTSSSFSSIPSTCSGSHEGSHYGNDDDDDVSNHHDVSNSSTSSSSTPRGSYRGSKSSVFSDSSHSTAKSVFSNNDSSSHWSSVPTNVESDNQSKPSLHLPCPNSPYQATRKVSDWMDSGKEDDNLSSSSKTNGNDQLSDDEDDLDYSAVDNGDSNDNGKSDSEYSNIVSEEDSVRNDKYSSFNMQHSSHEDERIAVYNDKINNESEPNAVDTEHEEFNQGWGADGILGAWNMEEKETDKVDNKQLEEVSKCEPDSTLSPNVNQSQHGSTSQDANSLIIISSSVDSSDSSDSESLKYLTKRCRQTPNHPNYGTSNTSGDIANNIKHEEIEQTTFIGSHNVVQDFNSQIKNDNNVAMKPPSRRRKTDNDGGCNVEAKRSKSNTHSRSSTFSASSDSGFVADGYLEEFVDNQKYGSKKWSNNSEHQNNSESSRSSKANSASQNANPSTQYSSYTSPSRHRSSRRDTTQYHRRNRSNSNKRTTNQSNVTTDNNGQSLNVKIDLSLINYNGKLSSESVTSAVPTATVVHGSANISPLSSSTSSRRDSGHNKQHSNDNNKASAQNKGNSQSKGNSQNSQNKGNSQNSQNKGNAQKGEESNHHSTYRTRSATSQKYENQHTGRNTASNNVSPVSVNSNNISNRDFPNSWRDGTDSSSDNAYESGYINSGTDEEVDFESDSSYEVAVPKSTAALLEEYASDESDESWTVGME